MLKLDMKNILWVSIVTLLINICCLGLVSFKLGLDINGFIYASFVILLLLSITSLSVFILGMRAMKVLVPLTIPNQLFLYSIILLNLSSLYLMVPAMNDVVFGHILLVNYVIAIYINTLTTSFTLFTLFMVRKKDIDTSEDITMMKTTVIRSDVEAPSESFKIDNVIFLHMEDMFIVISSDLDNEVNDDYIKTMIATGEAKELTSSELDMANYVLDNVMSDMAKNLKEDMK